MSDASLTFHGAAGTVTGAKFLLEGGRARLLLECGMFQGPAELTARNWTAPPLAPTRLDAVVLSHAHIDHSGYLPRLVRDGFDGPVYCSAGTAALLRIMLPDAARLGEEEAEYRNRKGTTRHRPALPLFTSEDAARALEHVRPVAWARPFAAAPGVRGRLTGSGHILGASVVALELDGRALVYSGDLGRYGVPIMKDPEPVARADVLLVESTYGDRAHPPEDGAAVLVRAVHRAVARRGVVLIPAFAVGRTQDLLYRLRELEEAGQIPAVPVHLDSPMGIAATVAYATHPEEHDADAARVAAGGRRPFVPARFALSRSVEDSRRLNDLVGPAVIIAGSGMATGGRILHHLRRRLAEPATTVLLAGFQAAGTRGRALRDGARSLRIFGEGVPVRAEVMATGALSAHADRDEIVRWLRGFGEPPGATWIVHGEGKAAASLRDLVERELGWPGCRVARDGERVPV